jgi:hypothetical protein
MTEFGIMNFEFGISFQPFIRDIDRGEGAAFRIPNSEFRIPNWNGGWLWLRVS